MPTDLRAKRSLFCWVSADPLTERGDLRRRPTACARRSCPRPRAQQPTTASSEHESRTADHAAAFAGRRCQPSLALLERFHRPAQPRPAAARPGAGSPRPRPCPCGGRTRAPSARRAHGLAPRRAPAARFPLVERTELVVSGGRRPARAGTAARRRRRRPRARSAAEQQRPRRCAHAFDRHGAGS